MDLLIEILLRSLDIITLVFGLAGVALSVFLLVTPSGVKSAGNMVNKSVGMEKNLAMLDKSFHLDRFVFNHHLIMGAALLLASVFVLFFLFIELDFHRLLSTFRFFPDNDFFNELFLQTIVTACKMGATAGFITGLLLMFAPAKLAAMEKALNSSLPTQPIVDRLNAFRYGPDNLIFRFPRFFGTIGFTLSMLLVVLSVFNMLT